MSSVNQDGSEKEDGSKVSSTYLKLDVEKRVDQFDGRALS